MSKNFTGHKTNCRLFARTMLIYDRIPFFRASLSVALNGFFQPENDDQKLF